jgi:glycosyltransferase involved in cell wall biosynthesis
MKKVIETQKDDIEIRLVGDGPCRRRLIDLARRLSIFDKVKFLGFITYEDKRHLEEYYNADIFTYPCTTAQRYIKEGIPNGIVEAMTAGLPVISTYHAGIPEIIKDNNTGLLVQEWDEKNLAESIKRLIEDEELRKRLGQNGQAFALKNLDVHAKTAKLEDIYDSLLK